MGPREGFISAVGGASLKDKRKEFAAKFYPTWMAIFNQAEEYGIDWRRMTFQQVEGAIVFAETFAKEENNEPD